MGPRLAARARDDCRDPARPTCSAPARGSRRILIGDGLTRSSVDHTVYDTTSIMRTIEKQFGLAPVATRDAAVRDLHRAVAAGRPPHH